MYYNVVQHHTIINSTKQWLTLTSDQAWNSQYPPHNRGRFKNTYELVGLGARKFSLIDKLHIFQSMCKIFCMEFQREPLKFHTKYLTHTWKEMIFIQYWRFRCSQIYKLVNFFETPPGPISIPYNRSYLEISWSLKAIRLVVWIIASLWNLTGTSAAMLPRRLSNFRVIGQF